MVSSMQVKSLEDGRFWGCSYMFSHFAAPEVSTETPIITEIYYYCGVDSILLERLIATWHMRLRTIL